MMYWAVLGLLQCRPMLWHPPGLKTGLGGIDIQIGKARVFYYFIIGAMAVIHKSDQKQ